MATVIAFTSGKGGVGKTNVATNLGLSLVERNSKVCLFDADTGLANINILLGISPQYTIEHVLNGQKSIDEIIINHSSGISVVPAASGIKQCSNLNEKQITLLTSTLEKLENQFDYLLIDTAAGIDSNVLDFVASAQYRVVVITSEPTSLTDSFALLKMLIIRGTKKSIFILVNKVDDYQASQIVFRRFQKAVKKYLKINVYYFGYLATDSSVNKAVAEQIPVVLSYPNSSVSCGFASLADIVKRQFKNDKNLPFFSRYWAISTRQTKPKLLSEDVKVISDKSPIKKAVKENKLSDIYALLNQQQLSQQQLKELLVTLESVYEKKYKQTLRDVHSTVALILAEGDEVKIKTLHEAVASSYEQQFDKKINNPMTAVNRLVHEDTFSKNDFNRLMEGFAEIYQQRFNEKYFSEGNALLTKIQQLVGNKS